MSDTITALATPPGTAGLAVIRLSGTNAISIADKSFLGSKKLTEVESNTISFGTFQKSGKVIDTVIATVFRSPKSYTGEDVVEISCHGGMIVVNEIIKTLIDNGARFAEPGEFTKRAFLNGKLDLMQVEAVADIIHASSSKGALTSARQLTGNLAHRISELRQKLLNAASLLELELDFSEEDIEFLTKQEFMQVIEDTLDYCKNLAESYQSSEILRSGYFVGIAGYPNSGKSTLFNALLKRNRAIVSEIPGTTRDYLEETLYLDDISVRITDTAGLRPTEDSIEIEGIKFVDSVLMNANLIIVLNDISISSAHSDSLLDSIKQKYINHDIILVQNKADKIDKITKRTQDSLCISAKDESGLKELKELISKKAKESTERTNDILVNQRHAVLLNQIVEELETARASWENGLDNTLIAVDIRQAINLMGQLTGEIWSEDILNNIFARFCIGK